MSKCTISRSIVLCVMESDLSVSIERDHSSTPINTYRNLTVRINDGEESFMFSCTPEFANKVAEALKEAVL